MAEEFYSIDDFNDVKKIDAHMHYNSVSEDVVKFAETCNFRLLSINTNIPGFPTVREQRDIILSHPSLNTTLFYLAGLDTADIFENNWVKTQLEYLEESIQKGACGFKIWKDIGMVIKKSDDEFIFAADDHFKPIFDWAENNHVSVLGHIGEPRNCWLPVEEMTVTNDKVYFRNHPEYHMYLHPEFPSYERLVQSFEEMLERHPRLQYVGAHFASIEWSFAEVAKRLDQFPLLGVDMAERISHAQYQSARNRDEVRNFFIKYQDRIIYGTDLIVDSVTPSSAILSKADKLWTDDWRYFTSDEELISPLVDIPFKGLKLPKQVIDKIYRGNAMRWYGMG